MIPSVLRRMTADSAVAPRSRRLLELESLLEAGEQGAKLGSVRPGRQHEGLEAVLQLIIGTERQVGLARADADQRDLQLVAEPAEQVEQLVLLATMGREHVVQLVDDDHAHAGGA